MQFLAVGTSPNSLADVPAPDAYGYGLQDVSSSDAGRVEDENATMYKMRIGQKRKVSLSWKDRDAATVAQVMQAFNPEYVFVRYLDSLSGVLEVREFYVGDRTTALRQYVAGRVEHSVLSFDLIER